MIKMLSLSLTSEVSVQSENIWEDIISLEHLAAQYLPEVIRFGLRLVLAVIFLVIGNRVIHLLTKLLRRALERAEADLGVMQFLDSLAKIILYFVLIMMVASGFGVDTASIIALVGSAGLTIGLAFQGSLSNFAGGVLILLLRPFRVGDYIIYVADSLEGTVEEIQICYTFLLTPDNRRVVVPNGSLSNNTIVNVTAEDKRRLDIDVGIDYSADLRLAKEICERLLSEEEMVLPGEDHLVVVDSLADSAVILKLRFWVKPEDYWAAKWKITEEIKLKFDENGIEIPYNQMEVSIHSKD